MQSDIAPKLNFYLGQANSILWEVWWKSLYGKYFSFLSKLHWTVSFGGGIALLLSTWTVNLKNVISMFNPFHEKENDCKILISTTQDIYFLKSRLNSFFFTLELQTYTEHLQSKFWLCDPELIDLWDFTSLESIQW